MGTSRPPPVLTKRADGSPLSAVGALLVGLEQRGPGRGSALLVKRLIPSASCSSSREALIVAVILRPGARCVRDHWRGGAAAAGVQDQLRQRARAVAARDGRQHPRHLSACRGGPRGARGARDASQGGGGAARGGGGPGAALRRARGALPQAVCARDVAAHGAHTQVGAPCPSSCPLLSCVVPLHRLPAVVVAPDSSSPSMPRYPPGRRRAGLPRGRELLFERTLRDARRMAAHAAALFKHIRWELATKQFVEGEVTSLSPPPLPSSRRGLPLREHQGCHFRRPRCRPPASSRAPRVTFVRR